MEEDARKLVADRLRQTLFLKTKSCYLKTKSGYLKTKPGYLKTKSGYLKTISNTVIFRLVSLSAHPNLSYVMHSAEMLISYYS